MDPEALQKQLWDIIEPVVRDHGLELWDLRFAGGRGGSLSIYVDEPEGGVTLDRCVAVSREVGVVLDVEDPIPGRYRLEVSSPGLDRGLRKTEHFLRYLGKEIRVELREPMGERRKLRGALLAVDDESLKLSAEGEDSVVVPRRCIKRANLVPPPPPFGAKGSQRERKRRKAAGRKE